MEIETKNASLATMAVTIQSLHVNGKQMTLAVFRQLPVGVEDSVEQVWGTVRYTIKDEGSLWIVFSKNDRLYRRALHLWARNVDGSNVYHAKEEIKKIEMSLERERDQLKFLEKILENKQLSEQTSVGYSVSLNRSSSKISELQDQLAAAKNALENHKQIYHNKVAEEEKRQQNEILLSQFQQLFIAV